MKKGRAKQSLIQCFEELYHYAAGPEEMIAQILTGHLAIEFLLRQLIILYDENLASFSDELSHARLIALSRDIGTISTQRASVLLQINKLRNRFAHEISYHPELSELLTLFKAAKETFTDYSDGLKEGIKEMATAKNIYDLKYKYHISELFLAIIYDLHQEIVARGGDEEVPHAII